MKTVLTVDDSVSIRQTVKLTLAAAGYNVIEAASGQAALDQCASAQVDMVITDLNMPGMDGITLIGQLRSQSKLKFTPILMLTTESQQEKKAQGKAAGATGWITKPFTVDQLVRLATKLCPP